MYNLLAALYGRSVLLLCAFPADVRGALLHNFDTTGVLCEGIGTKKMFNDVKILF